MLKGWGLESFFFTPFSHFSVEKRCHGTSAEAVAQAAGKWRSLKVWNDITHRAEHEERYKALALVGPPGCSRTPLGLLHLLERRCFRQATCAFHPTYGISCCVLLSKQSEDTWLFPQECLEEQKLPYKCREESRKMSLQAKCLHFGASGGWDPRRGSILAPLLVEVGEPGWLLPTCCLCPVYVGLTDKAVMDGCSHPTALLLCVPVRWGLDVLPLSTDCAWERNIGKNMKQQILGLDFAKLGTGAEEEKAVVQVNPGN